MAPRIIVYYQTFNGIQKILDRPKNNNITHIHLSSIHFGKDENNIGYIHLNNNSPYDKIFDSVWEDMGKANEMGIKIILMIGGAGGAFTDLFQDVEYYYGLLYKLIKNKPIIKGLDLDIEEIVDLKNVKKLINRVKVDFGQDFIISVAPIQSSLEYDSQGMGGFIYKDLLNSPEGKLIDYFNGQFYSDYTLYAYDKVVNNKYKSENIVMGMLGSTKDIMDSNFKQVKSIYKKYGDKFGGVFLWEYYLYPEFVDNSLNILY